MSLALALFVAGALFWSLAPYVPDNPNLPVSCGAPLLSARSSPGAGQGFLAPSGQGVEYDESEREYACPTASRVRLVQALVVAAVGVAVTLSLTWLTALGSDANRMAGMVVLPFMAGALFLTVSPYVPHGHGQLACGSPLLSSTAAEGGSLGFLAPVDGRPGR